MEKIFQDANDVHVTAVVVYGKAANSKLYEEAAYTNQVAQSVVEDAFLKGVLLVKVGDDFFRPVKVSGNKVTIAELAGSPAAATLTEYQAKASA
jgi:hypothetical protein